jgi:hypothetical protein
LWDRVAWTRRQPFVKPFGAAANEGVSVARHLQVAPLV